VTDLTSKLKQATEKKELENDPVKWIEHEFIIPETRNDPRLHGRFKLWPHQRDMLREIFSKDDEGKFKYDIIIWSDIKKSWKSSIAAAVTLFRCEFTEWGEQYVVANDLKQADSRVNHYIRRAISLNPKLKKKYKTQGYRVTAPSGSFIEAVPIDPSGEAGSNPDGVVFSELWGANEKAKQHMWTEMAIPPSKHGYGWRWVESYAGFAEESDLLYSLYEMGVKQGELLWPGREYPMTYGGNAQLEAYVNRENRMFCYWGTVPRLPDQTEEYYRSESNLYAPNEFLRMHRNQWVSSTETFVPMEWWRACKRADEEWPEFEKREERHDNTRSPFTKGNWSFIITLDAAVSGASLGLWMGCRHPRYPTEVLEVYAQKWEPGGRDHKIDFYGTDENPGMEKVLRRLLREYNVIEVAYDEFQLHSLCSRLNQEGLGWFRPFPQTSERLIGDSLFRDMIRERRYWHQGNPDMAEHVQNADAKIDPEDRRIRIVKRAERLHVDLAVCAAMGCRELMRLNL
jgi:hypothetical protein